MPVLSWTTSHRLLHLLRKQNTSAMSLHTLNYYNSSNLKGRERTFLSGGEMHRRREWQRKIRKVKHDQAKSSIPKPADNSANSAEESKDHARNTSCTECSTGKHAGNEKHLTLSSNSDSSFFLLTFQSAAENNLPTGHRKNRETKLSWRTGTSLEMSSLCSLPGRASAHGG